MIKYIQKFWSFKWATAALLSLTCQQMIVALSTWMIAALGAAVASRAKLNGIESSLGHAQILLLLGFVVSLFVVYLPGFAYVFFLEKLKLVSLQKLVVELSGTYFGRTSLALAESTEQKKLGLSSGRQIFEPWLTKEGPDLNQDVVYVAGAVVSLLLNITLNIFVICWFLGAKLLLGYGLAALAVIVCFYVSAPILTRLSSVNQKQRLAYAGHLNLGWDNLLPGNSIQKAHWSSLHLSEWKLLSSSAIRLAVGANTVSAGCMVAGLSVLSVYYYFQYFSNPGDAMSAAMLGAFIASLPRQMQIIQAIHECVHVGSEVVRLKERCQLLFESQDKAQRSKESIWLTKVQTSNVSVSGNVSGKALHKYSSNRGVVDPAALASDLKHSSSGLWTIRGPNGSGKSSLLKYLNSQIEGSFFLPSHLEGFALPAVDLSQKSSGQRVLEAFRFLVSNLDKHTVIFLDEWDAHLDDEARKECEQLVSQMSNLSVVVQVVHSPDL